VHVASLTTSGDLLHDNPDQDVRAELPGSLDRITDHMGHHRDHGALTSQLRDRPDRDRLGAEARPGQGAGGNNEEGGSGERPLRSLPPLSRSISGMGLLRVRRSVAGTELPRLSRNISEPGLPAVHGKRAHSQRQQRAGNNRHSADAPSLAHGRRTPRGQRKRCQPQVEWLPRHT
jgi:hypothetical protein